MDVKEYDVFAGDTPAGRLTISRRGLLTVYDMTADINTGEILRLAAVSGGGYIPVGVLCPEGGTLRVHRSFTSNDLLTTGLAGAEDFCLVTGRPGSFKPFDPSGGVPEVRDDVPPAEAVTASEQAAEDPPAEEVQPEALPSPDDEIWTSEIPDGVWEYEHVSGLRSMAEGALYRREGGTEYLAVRASGVDGSAMAPVFYYGETRKIGGAVYEVFSFDGGRLVTG